jgi:7-carboxy-7-deazaguanine synthase
MLISEIFYSIQGEGELTGVPSIFVRTSGCNLRCAWCDTPYASWTPEGKEMTVPEILAEVANYPGKHCVLTGGEPMIARGIRDLASALQTNGYHITIETAGTIAPNSIACDLVSLSPKFANSTPEPGTIGPAWIKRHEETRWQPEILQDWITNYTFQFKLVVALESEANDALTELKNHFPGLSACKIFLMPEGTDSGVLRTRADWLIDFCKRTGCRYCDRLHIHLFGNTKGT